MAGLSLRSGRRVVERADGAHPAGVPGCPGARPRDTRRCRGRLRLPARAGVRSTPAIRSGLGPRAAGRHGAPIPHPSDARHGDPAEGRPALHARSAPLLLPARVDASGRAVVPGDRPPAGGCADERADPARPPRERAPVGGGPADLARRVLGARSRDGPVHVVRRDGPDLRIPAAPAGRNPSRDPGAAPPGRSRPAGRDPGAGATDRPSGTSSSTA